MNGLGTISWKQKKVQLPSTSGSGGSQHSFASSSWSGSGWGTWGRRGWSASGGSQRAQPSSSIRMQETLKLFVGDQPSKSSG